MTQNRRGLLPPPHRLASLPVRPVRQAVWLACLSLTAAGAAAAADPADTAPTPAAEDFAIHGQATFVQQHADAFRAPYAGPNSLSPSQTRETSDATLYLGARLWRGAEAWLVPELDEGFGLDNTLGVAGFTSGEAYKVGKHQPYLRLPRAFIRQTVDTGDAREPVEPGALQLGGSRGTARWVFTLGKFGVTDLFDTNQYAHDPRADFLNWSVIDSGSFDYAADAWGFTVGAAAERYQGPWTFRAGIFDLSNVPNSPHLDPGAHEFQVDAEIERRYEVGGAPGRAAVTLFDSRARMGLLGEAVDRAAATGQPVDIAAIRRYRSRLGASFNLEQQLAAGIGAFARIGRSAGNVEAYDFTDIDRSMSLGLSVQGTRWRREHDTVGLAFVANGISAQRERYLAAGGLGILVGDGRLPHPGPEHIVEGYYSLHVFSQLSAGLDYQWIQNPAYNRERGPASVLAIRLHAQF